MRVIHLNYLEYQGGAAHSTFRIHDGLRRIGVESTMLVLHKSSADPSVQQLGGLGADVMRRRAWGINRLPARIYRRRNQTAPWSVNWFPYTNIWKQLNADLVHLHWIGANFLPISAWSQLSQPVIWTLKDSWAFTGGCHIPHDCRRYEGKCGRCPILHSDCEQDLSRWTWSAKSRAFPKMAPVVVTASTWMAECARRSSLLGHAEIHTIPHPLDLERFRQIDRSHARTTLGLPQDRPLIAFGAMSALTDMNKGADLLLEALLSLGIDADLLVFGSDKVPEGLGRRGYAAGTVTDDRMMAAIYSASDVFVLPSRSESFSLTTQEALACGTPVVAFNSGGPKDLIDHKVNGYLAEPFDTADLARGITWVLEDPERHARLRAAARAKAEREYEITHITRRYLALYEDILSRRK